MSAMMVIYERSGLLPSGGPQPGTTALRGLICDVFKWCRPLPFYMHPAFFKWVSEC
jgi:hypothetical protein